MRTVIIIINFLFVFNTSATNVYKCEDNDTTTYSQTPCDDNNIKINVYEPQSYKSSQIIPQNYNNDDISALDETHLYILKKKITRKIKKIENLTKRMNKEIDLLKLKSLNTSNNLAGANYKKALSNEMITTSTKYKALINVEQNKLKMMHSKANR